MPIDPCLPPLLFARVLCLFGAAGLPSQLAQTASNDPSSASAASKALPSLERANALSTAELVQRRDLWPAKVKLTKDARLDATTWFRAGSELPLVSFDGSNVGLDEGTFLFEWPAASTDVVERTRAYAASLSKDAFDLTYDGLRAKPDLWPTVVKITGAQRFSDNTVVPAGREVAVRFFEGADLAVFDPTLSNYYTLEPNQTDIVLQARARLELPPEQREPFFLRSLAAALESPDPALLARLRQADYVMVYSGRLGCPRCMAFTPELSKTYARLRQELPQAKFEVLYLSSDPSAEQAARHAKEAALPGGVIAFDRRIAAANLMAIPQRLLPGAFVFDRQGALLERNHADGGSPSAQDVLAKFEALLRRAPQAAGQAR